MSSAATHSSMKMFSNILCSYLTDPPCCCGKAPNDKMEYRPGDTIYSCGHFQCEECGNWIDIENMDIAVKIRDIFTSSEYRYLLSILDKDWMENQYSLYNMYTIHLNQNMRKSQCQINKLKETICLLEKENSALISSLSQSVQENSALISSQNLTSPAPTLAKIT